jgi:hypothetical protein
MKQIVSNRNANRVSISAFPDSNNSLDCHVS